MFTTLVWFNLEKEEYEETGDTYVDMASVLRKFDVQGLNF